MAQSAASNRAEQCPLCPDTSDFDLFRPDQLPLVPLFQGVRFGGGRIEFSSSMVILLELSEDGMVRRMPDPLNYGSFREWCRRRLGLGTDKGRCL
jgi:hypothetical protein